jgi:pyruvate,water dikinase
MTEIRMNINFSDVAFFYRYYPCDGVGMVRQEVLILENVGVHPKALMEYEKLKKNKEHKKLVELIEEKTRGYSSPKEYYIDKLALAMGKIAAAFYPRQVIVKLNDFKSNEYSTIPGGEIYEPKETNPIIGWRSARYYSEEYKPVFGVECEALRRVREDMGLENIHAMVPYCRTPEEGREILKTMSEFGLKQGRGGFKVICEVEVPVSILLMDEYAEIFDDFQIGSSCLTQAVLCIDKDNPLTGHLFDERHPAMKKIFAEAIHKAHKYGRTIGIVGQAVSDYPEFTEFVVKGGIDSISLNPDPETFFNMKERVAEEEAK